MAPSIPQHDVFSTGDNSYGQLFGKPSLIENEFVINNGLKNTLKNEKFITQIGAGDDYTAFLTHDNSLFVAGYNASNFIGLEVTAKKIQRQQNGNTNYYGSYGSTGTEFIVDEPTIVPPSKFKKETITHLSCGSNHICVVTNKSDIHICGLLGNGFVKLAKDKYPKEYKQDSFISLVGSGLNFSVFIVNMSDVYLFSQVPNLNNTGGGHYWMGSVAASSCFFETDKSLVYKAKKGFEEDNIVSLACGKNHFIVLTDQNEIYGMGSNYEGQLGETGEESYENSFVKIKLPEPNLRISSIQCGSLFSAYIAGNKLFMSGSNQFGQLGLGYKTKFTGFTEVMTIFEDYRISCGRNHSIIHLVKSNQVLVSGFNGEGQLGIGNGPNIRSFRLLDMKFDKKIAHILCGRASSIIVTQSGFKEMVFKQKLFEVQSNYCKFIDISVRSRH